MLEHLPPGNAAERELSSPWDDKMRLLHDISSSLRALYTLTGNVYRAPGTPERELELLPTPETKPPAAVPAEQRAEERGHLQAVLARRDPH